jgi:hypothetical protein
MQAADIISPKRSKLDYLWLFVIALLLSLPYLLSLSELPYSIPELFIGEALGRALGLWTLPALILKQWGRRPAYSCVIILGILLMIGFWSIRQNP